MPEEDSAVVGLTQKYFSLVEQGNNIAYFRIISITISFSLERHFQLNPYSNTPRLYSQC